MLRFVFELLNPESESVGASRTGFDLGHMSVHGTLGQASSKERTPPQTMMIYLAIVELLDGTRQLSAKGESNYRFVGADSSFALDFSLGDNEFVTIAYRREPIARVEVDTLTDAVLRDVQAFIRDPRNALADHDPVQADLANAFHALTRS